MLNTGKQPFFMVLLYSLFTYLELNLVVACIVDVTPLQPLVEAVTNSCSSRLDRASPELIKHRHQRQSQLSACI